FMKGLDPRFHITEILAHLHISNCFNNWICEFRIINILRFSILHWNCYKKIERGQTGKKCLHIGSQYNNCVWAMNGFWKIFKVLGMCTLVIHVNLVGSDLEFLMNTTKLDGATVAPKGTVAPLGVNPKPIKIQTTPAPAEANLCTFILKSAQGLVGSQ
ncbi:hypothetical protein ACJX0J_024588, partial [Zea mays]